MSYEQEGMPQSQDEASPESTSQDNESSESSKVEFYPPEGMKEPKEDVEMTARCRYRYSDGKICLTEFAGHKMPGYEDEGGDHGDSGSGDEMSDSDNEIAALGMGQE